MNATMLIEYLLRVPADTPIILADGRSIKVELHSRRNGSKQIIVTPAEPKADSRQIALTV